MKTKITVGLSKKSLENAEKFLNNYKNSYSNGVKNSIEHATEAMYNKVLHYCYANGIANHVNKIHREYNKNTGMGRVWTDDMVIIFNEMGTGIVGLNNSHPNSMKSFKSWKYDVNEHGEKGWVYPKDDGTFGFTKGLPSRHMFFDAFNDIKGEIGNITNVEIRKTTGDLY